MDSSLKSLHLQQHTRYRCFDQVPPSRPVSPLNWPNNKAPEWKVVYTGYSIGRGFSGRLPGRRTIARCVNSVNAILGLLCYCIAGVIIRGVFSACLVVKEIGFWYIFWRFFQIHFGSYHERNVYFEEISFCRLLRDLYCRFFIRDESVDSMC